MPRSLAFDAALSCGVFLCPGAARTDAAIRDLTAGAASDAAIRQLTGVYHILLREWSAT